VSERTLRWVRKHRLSNSVVVLLTVCVMLGLERYRKAIEDCKAAAICDASFLEAFLTHGVYSEGSHACLRPTTVLVHLYVIGDALVGIGKVTDALVLWRSGIDSVTNGSMLDTSSEAALDLLQKRMATYGTKMAVSTPAPVISEATDTLTFTKPSSALTAPVLERIQQAVLVGHSCVNSGQYDKAVSVFNVVLKEHPTVVEAYLGRGSAYAMTSNVSFKVVGGRCCVFSWMLVVCSLRRPSRISRPPFA
jgi:hypothetical protein